MKRVLVFIATILATINFSSCNNENEEEPVIDGIGFDYRISEENQLIKVPVEGDTIALYVLSAGGSKKPGILLKEIYLNGQPISLNVIESIYLDSSSLSLKYDLSRENASLIIKPNETGEKRYFYFVFGGTIYRESSFSIVQEGK